MDKLDKLEDEEEPEVEYYIMQNAPSKNVCGTLVSYLG